MRNVCRLELTGGRASVASEWELTAGMAGKGMFFQIKMNPRAFLAVQHFCHFNWSIFKHFIFKSLVLTLLWNSILIFSCIWQTFMFPSVSKWNVEAYYLQLQQTWAIMHGMPSVKIVVFTGSWTTTVCSIVKTIKHFFSFVWHLTDSSQLDLVRVLWSHLSLYSQPCFTYILNNGS